VYRVIGNIQLSFWFYPQYPLTSFDTASPCKDEMTLEYISRTQNLLKSTYNDVFHTRMQDAIYHNQKTLNASINIVARYPCIRTWSSLITATYVALFEETEIVETNCTNFEVISEMEDTSIPDHCTIIQIQKRFITVRLKFYAGGCNLEQIDIHIFACYHLVMFRSTGNCTRDEVEYITLGSRLGYGGQDVYVIYNVLYYPGSGPRSLYYTISYPLRTDIYIGATKTSSPACHFYLEHTIGYSFLRTRAYYITDKKRPTNKVCGV